MNAAPPALRLELRPSRRLGFVLGLGHGIAAVAVLATGLPPWVAVALLVPIAASCAYCLHHAAFLRSGASIVVLEIGENDEVRCQSRRGEWFSARISDSSFVSPLLTVINLEIAGRRAARNVVIVPDGVDADDFRRLRVRLRWPPPRRRT